MARADLIEAQRQALLQEMQHIRKDIIQQESWLRASPLAPCPAFLQPSPSCNVHTTKEATQSHAYGMTLWCNVQDSQWWIIHNVLPAQWCSIVYSGNGIETPLLDPPMS